MRLQRRMNRKVRGKTYDKWIVTLPPELVDEVRWAEGQELVAKIDRGAVRLTVVPKARVRPKKAN